MYDKADKNDDGKICIEEMYHAVNRFFAEEEADFVLEGRECISRKEAKFYYNHAVADGHDLPPFRQLFD